MQLRLLAIIWLTMLIIEATPTNRRSNIVSQFSNGKSEDFDLFGNWKNFQATTTESQSRDCLKKSLSTSDLFRDPNYTIDPESLKPHVRVKRRSNSRRTIGKSPSYVHRVPRRTYETFLSEEMNPADESEAEYGGSLDDDIDVPGTLLNDEMTMKRNSLEDVYPEVKIHHAKRDHSPPEFLTSDSHSTARLKRAKERECDYEEGEEYYYEDDEENGQDNEGESEAIAPKVDSSVNTAKESVEKFQSNQEENAQTLQISQNQNEVQAGSLKSRDKEAAYVANGKPAEMPWKKKSNNSKHKLEKPKPNKKAPVAKKTSNAKKSPPKSHKQAAKSKHDNKKPKSSISSLVDSKSNQLKSQKHNVNCCGGGTDKKKNKMVKTIVIKAMPSSGTSQKMQIKVEPSKPAAKNHVVDRKAQMSMGEMRDLLNRLIVKVDDLRSLVSELNNNERIDAIEDNSDQINCIAKTRRRAAGA